MATPSAVSFSVRKVTPTNTLEEKNFLAVEEPLEIRIATGSAQADSPVSISMRTPGHDEELAIGFLFTEGLIRDRRDVNAVETQENSTRVVLRPDLVPDIKKLDRNFYTTSSCGVCGKASLDAVSTKSAFGPAENTFTVSSTVLNSLQEKLSGHQKIFNMTGGLHASALFNKDGSLLLVREDVGRHNALDKVIGASLMNQQLPLSDSILLLSGRISFELVQKACMAGIPFIAAIGAPSSLAVTLAEENNVTLVGFLRDNRYTIYSGVQRIA
ncbi:MAG: formate dehydrogenase accessory sulfurtransferase FdhD [Cyclobacteriaceae bacterium]|nr:formate dehydrogenase accessory sulfurtransferase FdhD [Cyclobacteriaceae bacterium]